MIKRVIDKYFELKFFKRVLIFSIVFAILFASIDLFINRTIKLFFPDQEVYAHLEDLARSVIDYQNFDALENSEILKDYTLHPNTQNNTLTLTLYGPTSEVIRMVFTLDNFALRSVKELRNIPNVNIILFGVCAIVYSFSGIFFSLAFNFIIKGVNSLNKKTSA